MQQREGKTDVTYFWLLWSVETEDRVSAANSQEISIYFNKYLSGRNKYFLAYFWEENKYILA